MLQLRFLTTDSHLVELARRYWDFDSLKGTFAPLDTSESAELGGGGLMTAGLLAGVCLAHDDAEPCPRCGEPAWFFATREEYLTYFRDWLDRRALQAAGPGRLCPNCAGQEENRQENDADLKASRPADAEKVLMLDGCEVWVDRSDLTLKDIIEHWRVADKPARVHLEDLSLEQAVFLDAYWRAGMLEDLDHLRSLMDLYHEKITLGPSFLDSCMMACELKDAGLILYHPHIDPNVRPDNSLQKHTAGDLVLHARYYFPVSVDAPGDPASLFLQIERAFGTGIWPAHWKGQTLALWRKVARWEVLEYLQNFLDTYALKFTVDKKTHLLVDGLLEQYSTAQACWMVRCVGRIALSSCIRDRIAREDAGAKIPELLQCLAMRAGVQKWEIKKIGRPGRCAQSMVSQVLFDRVLKVGEEGWTAVPRELSGAGG